MWRAMFLALGVYSIILGAEALAVERAVLKRPADASSAYETRVIAPPDWAPWSLMGGGAVVVLYSFSLPRRIGG